MIMIALLIATLNALFFGAMFVLMHYYELIGSDVAFFDDGSLNNLKIINSVLGALGINLDPSGSPEVTTKGYGICLGASLLLTWVAVTIANRAPREEYEVTDAKK